MVGHSLRTDLYDATKSNHGQVEYLFDFSNGISAAKLRFFYLTLLTSRVYYSPILKELEQQVSIATYNDVLIDALRQDLQELEGKNRMPGSIANGTVEAISQGVGVFYVFAGSAMGARLLLKQIHDNGLHVPTNYLNVLTKTSKKQLTVLKKLLELETLNEGEVIRAAQQTFDFIYKTGQDGV